MVWKPPVQSWKLELRLEELSPAECEPDIVLDC